MAHARRAQIRQFKKILHAGAMPGAPVEKLAQARQAAQDLLRHSVQQGHQQLALMRLVDAVNLRAPIDANCWAHCLNAARALGAERMVRGLQTLNAQPLH